jgi:hypothetical protein
MMFLLFMSGTSAAADEARTRTALRRGAAHRCAAGIRLRIMLTGMICVVVAQLH